MARLPAETPISVATHARVDCDLALHEVEDRGGRTRRPGSSSGWATGPGPGPEGSSVGALTALANPVRLRLLREILGGRRLGGS